MEKWTVQKTHNRSLSSWTVHFGLNDRPVWLKTGHYRATVNFKDRLLSPFWTAHFEPDSYKIVISDEKAVYVKNRLEICLYLYLLKRFDEKDQTKLGNEYIFYILGRTWNRI